MFGPEHFPESGNGCFQSDRSVDLIRAHVRIFCWHQIEIDGTLQSLHYKSKRTGRLWSRAKERGFFFFQFIKAL